LSCYCTGPAQLIGFGHLVISTAQVSELVDHPVTAVQAATGYVTVLRIASRKRSYRRQHHQYRAPRAVSPATAQGVARWPLPTAGYSSRWRLPRHPSRRSRCRSVPSLGCRDPAVRLATRKARAGECIGDDSSVS
jgi:hypothetical protein